LARVKVTGFQNKHFISLDINLILQFRSDLNEEGEGGMKKTGDDKILICLTFVLNGLIFV